MFGFVIGTACLIGLVKVVRAGRRGAWGHGGCGRGFGHHHGGHAWHRRGWGGDSWGERFRSDGRALWLRGLFERLDTSPGQEKVIKQAAEEIFAATRPLKSEVDDTRRDIASALRSGVVDETQLGELFARHDDKLRELRKATVGALARVNDALDEDQRKRLADLIERGFWGRGEGRFGGGPYRDHGRGPRGGEWA